MLLDAGFLKNRLCCPSFDFLVMSSNRKLFAGYRASPYFMATAFPNLRAAGLLQYPF